LTSSYIWPSILSIVLVVFLYIRRSKKKTVGKVRGIDRSLTYPRQYPVGWYHLCDSDDIPQGQLKHFYIVGREMVAFRGDDEHRQISVVEAYCVHLGANLGVGGRVMPGTNCIQCPFHLWEFDGKDGRCTKIPYMDGKIPEKVKTFLVLRTICQLILLGSTSNISECRTLWYDYGLVSSFE